MKPVVDSVARSYASHDLVSPSTDVLIVKKSTRGAELCIREMGVASTSKYACFVFFPKCK